MERQLACDLSNDVISNDLKWPLTVLRGHSIIWRWVSQKRLKIRTAIYYIIRMETVPAEGGPIWIKFGTSMRNEMSITTAVSKSNPEVEFQYDGRLFFQTGSSYISAPDWVIPTKFGLFAFDVLKTATSPSVKSKVKLRRCSRHLENGYYDIITLPLVIIIIIIIIKRWSGALAVSCPIWIKFGIPMKKMPIMVIRLKLKAGE